MINIVYCILVLFLTACTSLAERTFVHSAKNLFDLIDEEREARSKDPELASRVSKLETQAKNLEIEREKVLHQGNIQIHNYYLHKNHLSPMRKAEIENRIKYHQEALDNLRGH